MTRIRQDAAIPCAPISPNSQMKGLGKTPSHYNVKREVVGIIAYTAGKMRRHRIRSVVEDRVHVEVTPYDLPKGRIIYRERTPGQGPGVVRQRMIRR